MATPSKIHLTVEGAGVVKNKPQNPETARRTSELLQENHEKHHITFNPAGYHNHIVHGLLTLYGLGAPKSAIETHYQNNSSYQRPPTNKNVKITGEDLKDPEQFKKFLGKEKYYFSYLKYFQKEMEEKGWENVLQEYVFAGDERADDMLGRMFAGFFHPIIHLGFGVEFHQPAIIAESLAQACIHDTWTGDYLLEAEKAAAASPNVPSKSMKEILDLIHADKKLSTAAWWEDGNKIRDGILKRAKSEMLSYVVQWKATPETLHQKTLEMITSCIYLTAASQHPPKQVKMDFYLMHSTNSSLFLPTLLSLPFLTPQKRVRLLTRKVYLDLALYASRRSPALLSSEITGYIPSEPNQASWEGLFERLFKYEDDGHAVKLGRAVRYGEVLMEDTRGEGNGEEEEELVKQDMWAKIGNMVVDSVEDGGETWVRSAGFEEAWEGYGERAKI